MTVLRVGSQPCGCHLDTHQPRLIVLTGGPGAGKTAVLETAARSFCRHVAILPEAASVVFGGGFPRHTTEPGRRAAQRAIYHVQREVERLVLEERQVAIGLCDRGTVDGAAYWPVGRRSYWREVGTTKGDEIGRYDAVVHLEPPSRGSGYQQSELRVESAREARQIDSRIAQAWEGHPKFMAVASRNDFLSKQLAVLELVRAELPRCCQSHPLPGEAGDSAPVEVTS